MVKVLLLAVSTMAEAPPMENPDGPYTTSQEVEVPFSTHSSVTLLWVTAVAVTLVGFTQDGIRSIIRLSIKP